MVENKKFTNLLLTQSQKDEIMAVSQADMKRAIMSLGLQTSIYEGNLGQLMEISLGVREDLIDPDMCPKGFTEMMRSGLEYYLQCKVVLKEYEKHYESEYISSIDKNEYLINSNAILQHFVEPTELIK